MELLLATTVAVVVGAAVYLMLTRELLRVILGGVLLSYGINLALFMAGGVEKAAPPILNSDGVPAQAMMDPIPQALILTAIVIGLGVFALLLALGYRTFEEHRTTDVASLSGVEHE